jgi:hypothetical protein
LAKFWTPSLITNITMCSYPQNWIHAVIRLDVIYERYGQKKKKNFSKNLEKLLESKPKKSYFHDMFSRRTRPQWVRKNYILCMWFVFFFSWFFSKSYDLCHIRCGSYVSVDEILNSWSDYKYNDVLISTKSGSCSDPSGCDLLTLRTKKKFFQSKSRKNF